MKLTVISGRNSEFIEKHIVESLKEVEGFENLQSGDKLVNYISDLGGKPLSDVDIIVVTDYGRTTIINWEDIRKISTNHPNSMIYLFTSHDNVSNLDVNKYNNIMVTTIDESSLPLNLIVNTLK